MTAYSPFKSLNARWDPRKPAAPVIRTWTILCPSSFRGGDSFLPLDRQRKPLVQGELRMKSEDLVGQPNIRDPSADILVAARKLPIGNKFILWRLGSPDPFPNLIS